MNEKALIFMYRISICARISCVAMLLLFGASWCRGQQPATAWKQGRMQVDVGSLVGRSDIVLAQPNTSHMQALPLGNGRLGAAVWSADGFTAQLNRGDTLPFRYATGQVLLPGVKALVSAADYKARLNLYDGTFEERGGGMTLRAYVQPRTDTLVVEITGVDPEQWQTAFLRLWAPRRPHATAEGVQAMLVESWKDDQEPGASGRMFGSLAVLTAEGRSIKASVDDDRSVSLRFKPNADGRFRIFVASPEYHGFAGSAKSLTTGALANRDALQHVTWWHNFWGRADPMKVMTEDGSGEYMEALRAIYLYSAAAESGGEYPGSQAGEADLFASAQDQHQWDPGAFWHWNLRMQVGANLGAGLAQLNAPYFRLYRNNLARMESWTRERMQGAPGICIPETMRFNGNGIEFERWGGNTHEVTGWNCDAASKPYYNARTLTTGAEVSLWIWRHYLANDYLRFLASNFPVMVESAHFLMAYEKPGADGLLHTSPTNAHETQWDVTDSATDLAARRALYTATIAAAQLLHRERALVARMQEELTKIPPLPRVLSVDTKRLLAADEDGGGQDIFTDSYRPGAQHRNVENIAMELVWPYEQIDDRSPQFDVARRTYLARPNKYSPDWSFDAVDAARLGMGDEVRKALISITEHYQGYINGFNDFNGKNGEFYVEQSGMVALALQEALVQDYDGTIRIAPAIPAGWDFDGRVSVRHGTKVFVQVRGGRVVTVGFAVKSAQTLTVRNPWPGEEVKVVEARSGRGVRSGSGEMLKFAVKSGEIYRMEPAKQGIGSFAVIGGTPATSMKVLGPVQIGLGPKSSGAEATAAQ